MKAIIIKILFRLLDSNDIYEGIDQDRIDSWLATQYKQRGFREYWRKRDIQILKEFGHGIEGKLYWMWVGRRLELLKMLHAVNQNYKVSKHKGRKKIRKK